MTAATECLDDVGLAVDVAVWRALEVSGKRLLTRDRRSRYQNIPPWELHTHIPVADHDLDRLLTGAWTCLRQALGSMCSADVDPDRLIRAADDYVRSLLVAGVPHEARWLAQALRGAGVYGGGRAAGR